MSRPKYRYFYFYKITNNINGHFYYGVHAAVTLDDGYMGSGKRLHYAYKKYGIENFTKEILKYFDTLQEAFEYESEMVTEEIVNRDDCYNIVTGGRNGSTKGYVVVKKKGETSFFLVDCSEYDAHKDDYETTWSNRKHTDEQKESIRRKMTPTDSKNPRVWITNKKGIVKYVRKDVLNKYLENGFSLGRDGYKPRKGMQGHPLEQMI